MKAFHNAKTLALPSRLLLAKTFHACAWLDGKDSNFRRVSNTVAILVALVESISTSNDEMVLSSPSKFSEDIRERWRLRSQFKDLENTVFMDYSPHPENSATSGRILRLGHRWIQDHHPRCVASLRSV